MLHHNLIGYMFKTPLIARFLYVFILKIRFLSTLTHPFNYYEPEIGVSNKNPHGRDG